MKFYETLLMLRNAVTETQIDALEAAFRKVIEVAGGGVLAKCDRWGKLKLAHPVEHKDYAYFALFRFKISKSYASSFPKELSHFLKIKENATVIRFTTMELSEEVFATPYKRPEAFIPSSSAGTTRGFGFGSGRPASSTVKSTFSSAISDDLLLNDVDTSNIPEA